MWRYDYTSHRAESAAGKQKEEAKASSVARCAPDVLFDQVMLDGVMHQLGVAGDVELLQDARAVGADCAGRERHFAGDAVDRLARGKQPHDTVLAVGKRFVRRLVGARR